MKSAAGGSLPLIAVLFVLSGAAALVDQVCFSKYLSYVVGATSQAVSAVLSAFMAGLALGALLGGRYAHRIKRPLVAYGVLEVVVFAGVAFAPLAFEVVGDVYVAAARQAGASSVALSLLRWLAAVTVVLIPTTAMGATLPLLSRLVESLPSPHERRVALGVLYAANTLGGAIGALGSAYLLLPLLGLRDTTWLAAFASLVVGIVAMAYGWRHRTAEVTPIEAPRADAIAPIPHWLSYLLAFTSGALVLGSEVLFVHLLVLLVGTSAYAFGVIIAIFLVCLFLGASLAPTLAGRLGRGALPLSLAATAVALAVTMGVWEGLPEMFRGVGSRAQTFAAREWVRGLAAFVALVAPTTAMGLTFPLLLQQAAERAGTGALVGRLTSINTVGAVVGSLLAGYVILPQIGSQRSIVLLAGLFGACSLLVLAHQRARTPLQHVARYAVAFVAVAGAAIAVRAPRWDLTQMTGGYHVYFDWGRGPERIVFVREDTQGGVTTVTEKDGVRTLLTNGKFQGNDGHEVAAQRFFAHYPLMFVRDHRRALVIGLGTGTTLGTVAAYPFERIDVVEISDTITHAAKTFFGPLGADALGDPRVSLYLEDGRNHITVTREQYDVVGIELTSVWFAGAGSLYSREFYELVRERLRPGGIFQQWIQMHHLRERDLAVVIHTLRGSFAHVALFYGGGQGILVASNDPLIASRSRLDELEVTLGRARPDRPLYTLTVDVLAETRGLDAFIAEVAKAEGVAVDDLLSTDDNLYLEYATPKGNVLPWSSREDLVRRVSAFRDGPAVSRMLVP